jgi:5-(carboxyamino)imidazole ribonucleotide synthase
MISPPGTIGIIGGGQLGMMAIREAQRMGYRSIVWDPDPTCPAGRLADLTITAPWDDFRAAEQLASGADVVTFEFEHISPDTVAWLEERKQVYPGSPILKVSQHRRVEKSELRQRGFPVVDFEVAGSRQELAASFRRLGLPVVVKTATAGYDGKGQTVLKSESESEAFLAALGSTVPEYVVERFLDLACEISVLVVREADGTVISFPVAENEHRENILATTVVPARVPPEISDEAVRMSREIIESFDMIGVLCVEMFVTREGTVIVNELAPRPHNSGHYSLDACDISQFEALVRAICGVPFHVPQLLAPCAMVNLLGRNLDSLVLETLMEIPGVKLHLYGKQRREAKRKMGHVTILGSTQEDVLVMLPKIYGLIGDSGRQVSTPQW